MRKPLTPDALKAFLPGSANPLDALTWLRDEFLPTIVDRLNRTDSRKRLALYGGDRIPENERNLTDFRNRISLVIEYEFARTTTAILDEAGVDDLFCAYVVANRFPDLEIRTNEGKRGLRFEVKCLQSTAEEKSANFSTLRKDIQPFTDFVVVFLWDWGHDYTTTRWDRAPYVIQAFVFNASDLATLRDWYWLNRPPANLGDGYQGFDIRYAVNCSAGRYHEEEGNVGKLLRLWQRDFQHRPPETELLRQTERDYLSFKEDVVVRGFEILAHQLLPALSCGEVVVKILNGEACAGFKSGEFGFLAASRVSKKADIRRLMAENNLGMAWLLRDKYQWRCFRRDGQKLELVESGRKPKLIRSHHLAG